MIGPWSLLLKIQKVHTHNLDYSYGKGTILSGVALSYFPQWLGQSETSKSMEIKAPVLFSKWKTLKSNKT